MSKLVVVDQRLDRRIEITKRLLTGAEDFEFMMVNALAEQIVGIPEGQLLKRRIMEVFPLTGDIGLFQMAVNVAETGRPCRTEQRFEGKQMDGWFNVSIARFGDGVIVSLSDITEFKRLEQERLENAVRLRAILDNTEEILYMLDAEGRYTYISPAISRVLGYKISDLMGKRISDYTHPEDVQTRFESIARVLSTGIPVRDIRYRVRHFDGSWRWFTATGSVTRGGIREAGGVRRRFLRYHLNKANRARVGASQIPA